MDDLDRLYFELVEILRRERPQALSEPFTVLELHDSLIPYRRVRDPAGLRSNDDYEAALSRFIAGERGYLLSDGNMQEEVLAGLDGTLPDIRRYRAFPDIRVWLNSEVIPPPGDIRYAPPELREQSEWSAPAAGATHEAPEPAEDVIAEEAGVSESGHEEPAWEEQEVEIDAQGEFSAGPEAVPEPEPHAEGTVLEPHPLVEPPTALETCPQCDAALPEDASFCPFCGFRLSPETCQTCGAEMDAAWRFCPACGTPRVAGPPDPA
jgi:RNA polymerase subunit RPABC4/transcription elongation factor Spt4